MKAPAMIVLGLLLLVGIHLFHKAHHAQDPAGPHPGRVLDCPYDAKDWTQCTERKGAK